MARKNTRRTIKARRVFYVLAINELPDYSLSEDLDSSFG